ncbi:MAG: Modulator of FtsH protease HflC [candidate division BRC1 bacterium ADurb.BinA292]|nr:MAG: Modulator of FtsH protease HflC [candidate division BRC1 bacterium ADurb.BinA292]
MTFSARWILVGVILIVVLVVAGQTFYTVNEREQVILTQFGEIVGEAVTTPGLKFKLPFIQKVHRLEKRVLEWDGDPNDVATKEKVYIGIDVYGRWRIADPKQFYLRLADERLAQSRLDDILDSATREAVARHDLIEIVRTTKGRVPVRDEVLDDPSLNLGELGQISVGRTQVEREIHQRAAPYLTELGVELLDIRIKRLNYNEQVQTSIYQRMISERKQLAEMFRSQGMGEAAKLRGRKEQELREIRSLAYKQVQQIRGAADARAAEIYAEAYNASPQAADFYRFLHTMATYESSLGDDTMVVLSTDSDLFELLKGAGSVGDAAAFAALAERLRDELPATTATLELEPLPRPNPLPAPLPGRFPPGLESAIGLDADAPTTLPGEGD